MSEAELVRLRAALNAIWQIVHVPTSKTPHRGALDHFQADFDAIRKIIRTVRAEET